MMFRRSGGEIVYRNWGEPMTKIRTYCYDPDFIETWQKLQTEYVTEPEITSELMVKTLTDKFGENCIPISVKVHPDCIETEFKFSQNGEMV